MNNLQLFLNNHLTDLSDDSPIALTFQINNLAEVKNQQGNTSNQFKLPLTQKNRRILGFPDEVAFTDAKPYGQYQARVIQDGLEILPYAIAELNGIEQDTAAITVLSGNVDFFDAIDDKLYSLGDSTTAVGKLQMMQPYNHDWSLQNVATSQTKTEGWIWPVVDYGNIPEDFTGTPEIDVRYMRPAFFLKTAMDIIVASAGYKIDPDSFLLKDELYPRLLIQFANDSFTHGLDYQNSQSDTFSCMVKTGSNQIFGNVDRYDGRLVFSNVVSGSSVWEGGDQSYKAPAGVSATVTFTFSATVFGKPKQHNGDNQTIGLELKLGTYNASGGLELTSTTVDLSNNPENLFGDYYRYQAKNIKLSVDIDLAKDDHIYVDYHVNNNKKGTITLLEGATLTITAKKQNVLYGQNIQCERIFPDISMKDLLKDTLQRFGIICQTNNTTRTVRLASFRDIVNNIPIAKNWSGKCLDQGKSISFQLGGYAQVNYMKYKADDNVPQTLGQSTINVADTTLPPTTNLFESQFAATLNRPYIGGSIAQILKVDPTGDSGDFSISTQPRILIDQKLPLNGRSIAFTDGANPPIIINDTISVPYFDKPDGQYSLTFGYLRQTYYPELQKILTQSKKVARYFLLTPRDILELDLLIPIYLEQDSTCYYISKIDSWRKGQPVKVELVKI